MKKLIKTRREFIQFLGYGTLTLTQMNLLSSCLSKDAAKLPVKSLFPSIKDDVVLIEGMNYYPLISWGDKMNAKEVFGFNNDYIDTHIISSKEMVMWVNHEYVQPIFVSSNARNKENVDIEKSLVGGSLIKVKKENGKWKFKTDDIHNRGVRANTMIPFANNVSVMGSKIVEGTLSNCAGGKTPWGNFLTCEENTDHFYGERDRKTGKVDASPSFVKWERFYPKNLPEHYGWVVEVEPLTGKAQKLTTLGRFAHESATCLMSKSSKAVVYSGDDKKNEHIYKFISSSADSFDEGILYVADVKAGKWLPLDLELSPILKKHYKTQLDVLIDCRGAAKLLGASEMNRPEDIEIHPKTGDVFIALTNNSKKDDYHGSILKISETGGDYTSLTFKSETFILGGEDFSCPDNLAFDRNGNLWIVTDMSTSSKKKDLYGKFGNNGLFVIPVSGDKAGQVIQVGSGPIESELTGLCFVEDQSTLFLSVQHPGERTKDLKNPTSTWPTGTMPKPTVIALHGKFLEELTKA